MKRKPSWFKIDMICWFLLSILSIVFISFQEKTDLNEYKVKAVFLFNFTHFVEWPENVFPDENSPFVIGILGNDPFGGYLEETIRSEKLKNHPLIIKQFREVGEIDEVHLLFIGEADENKMLQILSDLPTKNILTVSDEMGFTEKGGMIRFLTVNNKIRIEINLNACQSAGLTISSKLLKLAKIVDPQNN